MNGGSSGDAVVAGVLTKHVNIAKGWRDRLFVLSGEHLYYFKIGRRGVNVQEVLEHYDPEGGNTSLIGAQTFVLQKDGKEKMPNSPKAQASCAGAKSSPSGKSGSNKPTPAGHYDLRKVKIRESGTESHKLYLEMDGQRSVSLRTETPDDRVAWVSALSSHKVGDAAKGSKYASMDMDRSNGGVSGASPRGASASNAIAGTPSNASSTAHAAQRADANLKRAIAELQRSNELSASGAQRIEGEVAALRAALETAQAALRAKEGQCRQLAEERRQLQTEMAASMRRPTANGELSSPGNQSVSDDDAEDDADDDGGSASGSAVSARTRPAMQVDGDAFYDANETFTRRKAAPDGAADVGSAAPVAATPGPATPAAASSAAPTTSQQAPAAGVVASSSEKTESGLPVPGWLQAAEPQPRRAKLPEPAETQKSVSLWAIIKECIGKDLTRICLPVFFNEPLSALQKMAEEFEYSDVMERAAAAPKGSNERLLFVAAFAVSGYSGTVGRTCKPFNPLLGETYEHVDARRRFRCVAEKVVHHPTVLAAHCEAVGVTVDADLEVRSKFWGRCIELKPVGRIQARFHDGETVTWNKVTTTINNLILGKIYIEHGGVMRVQSDCTSAEARVKFKDGGMFNNKRTVSGGITKGGQETGAGKLEGTWDESVSLDFGSGAQVVWKAAPPAKDPTRYNLSQFAIELNELTPGLQKVLPPTDCRLRPDQAALERGYFEKANKEKQRLEQKQRRARKEAEEGKPIHSRWFKQVDGAMRGDALSYAFTGEYWQQREAGHYTGCRDIFGPDEPGVAEAGTDNKKK